MSRRIPLEGRSKPHWDTGAICNSGHENIYGNKSTNIRIKAYFLSLLTPNIESAAHRKYTYAKKFDCTVK